ncbi:MAG TPA: hypothetical protein VFX07_13190 [Candidatus Udaeobacter sp.]|jgi:hypothetical protein|nr:hypothetical protein [Candidatus Udaeobacter sp.]
MKDRSTEFAMLLNEFLKEHKRVEEQAREMREQKVSSNKLTRRVETALTRLHNADR